jgi:phosphatidylglycerol lysyltransferase
MPGSSVRRNRRESSPTGRYPNSERKTASASYRCFNLGMAPLSGFEDRPLAPAWNRVSAFVYRHGEHFYNFQGLRQYKEKFDPQWEPRYLASPGGLILPRILADLALLIGGGLRGVLAK